ncbi:SDR family oxidoreductase [Streptomyces sp. NBC_00445]|uniref:SDR family NAD(P)-dependent oxidoreductase n=1 Tax=unclassified Streptomyces TaxID=2593676 RepID=UPI002E1AE484|nr:MULTISPECIES: glucose 1-dehydrogenase [unclassified Streptomyces]
MASSMKGKAGLVTAAGSGIGQAAAVALAQAGACVMVSDIDETAGAETVAKIEKEGGTAAFLRCDVSDEAQVEALVGATVSAFGNLDFAFNNAGTNGVFAPIGDMDSAVWDRVMKVSLYSLFYCLKHEVRAMEKSRGGAIVNTASGAGLIGIAHNAPYTAAKFGVVGMTRNVAMDYAPKGIRVNALAPGSTATPMMMNAFEQNPGEEFRNSILAGIPMGVLAEPEDQADAVVWLCSDQARMVTGVTLPVDGGYLAGK